jgi:hypothetical protein
MRIVLQQQPPFPVSTRHHFKLSGKIADGVHGTEDVAKSKQG